MEDIIKDDIYRFLYSISIQYNISLEILIERYLPIINIQQKYTYKVKKKSSIKEDNLTKEDNSTKKTHFKINPHTQCIARVWNNGHVHYDETQQQWICGGQCKRNKFGSSDLCSIHNNTIKKHGSLSHGKFSDPPPHQHFQKFIIKKQMSNT